ERHVAVAEGAGSFYVPGCEDPETGDVARHEDHVHVRAGVEPRATTAHASQHGARLHDLAEGVEGNDESIRGAGAPEGVGFREAPGTYDDLFLERACDEKEEPSPPLHDQLPTLAEVAPNAADLLRPQRGAAFVVADSEGVGRAPAL